MYDVLAVLGAVPLGIAFAYLVLLALAGLAVYFIANRQEKAHQ